MNLDTFSDESMHRYGMHTILQRAIPDFRDGLLPVQRHLLYSMHKMGLHYKKDDFNFVKSAKPVSYCMSSYHPHGDTSIYGTLVRLANEPVNTVEGWGNFGSLTSPPGASRYTNCRLSEYGSSSLLNDDYMAVAHMCPNYDEKEEEPIILPSLLPNLLINGCFGIAVGISTHIPPFKIDGIKRLITKCLNGETLTPQACARDLKFNYKFGGDLFTGTKEHKDKLIRFFETGVGSATFLSTYTADEKDNSITITRLAPSIKPDEDLLVKIAELPFVADITDATDKDTPKNEVKVVVTFKRLQMDAANIRQTMSHFVSKMDYRLNVVENKLESSSSESKAVFRSMTLVEFFGEWTKYRVSLELSMLTRKKEKLEDKLKYVQLQYLVAQNYSAVIDCLRSDDETAALVSKFNLDEDQAKTILGWQIRTLSKKNQDEFKNKILSLTTDIGVVQAHILDPNAKIIEDLSKL